MNLIDSFQNNYVLNSWVVAMKRMINKNLSILSEWGWRWGVPMNQTNIKQWACSPWTNFFLNHDLLDTFYQGALYMNQISFFSPNINQISFFFPRNFCIIYKKKKMKNASDKSFTCIYLSYRYTCRLLGICWKRKT